MKKQILTLVIGALIGAIITTGVFLVIRGNESTGSSRKGNRQNLPTTSIDGNATDGSNGKTRKRRSTENTTDTNATTETNILEDSNNTSNT